MRIGLQGMDDAGMRVHPGPQTHRTRSKGGSRRRGRCLAVMAVGLRNGDVRKRVWDRQDRGDVVRCGCVARTWSTILAMIHER